MKTISYWIRGYFGFSQKEASGFIILSSLIIISLFTPTIFDLAMPSVTGTAISDQKLLDSLLQTMRKDKKNVRHSSENTILKEQTIKYIDFDPNSATESMLQQLGIQKFLAARIIKYRSKGGKFRVKADLSKIYGFPPILFNQLRNYILLPDSVERQEKKLYARELPAKSFDINKADTFQLNTLKGIGNTMSLRIIKYRDKLGGFVNTNQYQEVYSISPLALEELNNKTFIQKDFQASKLNINTAGLDILSAHPYVGRKLAGIIYQYRTQHAPFQKAADLSDLIGISPEQIRKLEPYLSY